ncbi:MAG TPA: cation:proton antiporter [Thermoplasmata archaeon]|nr:cation:proton antiporter [Thermoplasmata archaeon]
MDFIVALLILFVAARLAGEAMEQIRQSPMIGEVLAGIVLGPTVLGLVDPNPLAEPGASLSVVAQLGVLVLVLLAGLELGREGLQRAFRERSMLVAMVAFFLPFALGYSLALALGMSFPQSLFLGTALAVTALPVSVRILMDLSLLHSRIGRAIVSVALVDDLVAFAMLGLILEFARLDSVAPDMATVAFVVGKSLTFLALVFSVSVLLKMTMRSAPDGSSHMQRLLAKLRGQESGFALGIILALALGAAAEILGIHFAVGVFYGGLLVTPKLIGAAQFVKIRSAVSVVTFGLLAPIFFGFVGLNFTLSFGSWPLIIAITVIAFFGKLFGGVLGGLFVGFRGARLVALGVGLNARGMMELLLAQVALAAGIIDAGLYSALVVMTLVTTLTTPPLLRRLLGRFRADDILPTVVPTSSELVVRSGADETPFLDLSER